MSKRQSTLTVAGVNLTPQERKVLLHLLDGNGRDLSIAAAMDIQPGTVRVHMKNLLRKFKVNSRVKLAIWADRNREQLEGATNDGERGPGSNQSNDNQSGMQN